ncbi:MAG TPA: hypothetical protein VEK08_04210 [Planctomycetota bacterium]|nr:hypothetical protein [Planctomycetota bacterium]
MNLLERISDYLALLLNGGIRVRVKMHNGQPQISGSGRAGRLNSQDLVRIIADLKPDAEGTIDVHQAERGCRVNVSGRLNESNFAQRLRNVIVNDAR